MSEIPVQLVTMFVRTPFVRIDGEAHPIEFTDGAVQCDGATVGTVTYSNGTPTLTVTAVRPDGTPVGEYRDRYRAAAALIRDHVNRPH